MFNKGQLAGLMQKAQEVQKNIQKAQEEIAQFNVDGEAGSGTVKVNMTGNHQLKKINIDTSVMDDKELLEDLIVAAVNDASRKVEEFSSKKMQAASSGMPGGLNLPF